WRFNGVNLSGATNSTLMLPNIQPEQAGDYTVAVYNSGGSAVSSNATIRVMIPAVILAQPQGVAVPPTNLVTFSVTAYSPSPLRYQWQFNGTNLPGQTNSSLSLSNVQPVNGGDYSVVVSDPISSIRSDPAPLIILIDPTIVVQPLS